MFQEVRRALLFNTQTQRVDPPKKYGTSAGPSDASQMFAEIAAKSTYQSQVQADIVKHGDGINKLIQKVKAFKAKDMCHLDDFVREVNTVLDKLTDQAAVLRNFDWPEARFDAFHEAVGLQKELQEKKRKFHQWQTGRMVRGDELKRMQ